VLHFSATLFPLFLEVIAELVVEFDVDTVAALSTCCCCDEVLTHVDLVLVDVRRCLGLKLRRGY
jgi:hypothetical protein